MYDVYIAILYYFYDITFVHERAFLYYAEREHTSVLLRLTTYIT